MKAKAICFCFCFFTFIVPSVCCVQATDGDAGTFGIVRYYFSDEPDQ